MIQEINIFIDLHELPWVVEVSDFQTSVKAVYICENTDLKLCVSNALDYYKKLYNQYLNDKKNGTKQQNKFSKNVYTLDLSC